VALSFVACHRAPAQQHTPQGVEAGARDTGVLVNVDPALRTSLYELPLQLTDQDGRVHDLAVFRGHPVVISMFYSSCPYACPTLISEIQRLERLLSPSERESTRVLLVSFDPERDTPQRLKILSRERHADEARWLFAQASPEDVRQLAAVLGLKYKRLADGGFNHSSVITVLDRQGAIRARSDGLSRALDAQLPAVIAALVKEPVGGG
jgi:protein SCO1/2